jgi:hypothetical protein
MSTGFATTVVLLPSIGVRTAYKVGIVNNIIALSGTVGFGLVLTMAVSIGGCLRCVGTSKMNFIARNGRRMCQLGSNQGVLGIRPAA